MDTLVWELLLLAFTLLFITLRRKREGHLETSTTKPSSPTSTIPLSSSLSCSSSSSSASSASTTSATAATGKHATSTSSSPSSLSPSASALSPVVAAALAKRKDKGTVVFYEHLAHYVSSTASSPPSTASSRQAALSPSTSPLILVLAGSAVDLRPLRKLPHLHDLTIISTFPLPTTALDVLAALPALSCLDLSDCRSVVDANNSAEGLCSAPDIWEFALHAPGLHTLRVPEVCALRIGSAAHVYAQASVVVVELGRSLRVGDVVQLRRAARPEAGTAALGEWRSKLSVVEEIRTDDHQQLQRAEPALRRQHPTDGQYAVRLAEVGRKCDAVYWMGHQRV